jgi:hypothetical protein
VLTVLPALCDGRRGDGLGVDMVILAATLYWTFPLLLSGQVLVCKMVQSTQRQSNITTIHLYSEMCDKRAALRVIAFALSWQRC